MKGSSIRAAESELDRRLARQFPAFSGGGHQQGTFPVFYRVNSMCGSRPFRPFRKGLRAVPSSFATGRPLAKGHRGLCPDGSCGSAVAGAAEILVQRFDPEAIDHRPGFTPWHRGPGIGIAAGVLIGSPVVKIRRRDHRTKQGPCEAEGGVRDDASGDDEGNGRRESRGQGKADSNGHYVRCYSFLRR